MTSCHLATLQILTWYCMSVVLQHCHISVVHGACLWHSFIFLCSVKCSQWSLFARERRAAETLESNACFLCNMAHARKPSKWLAQPQVKWCQLLYLTPYVSSVAASHVWLVGWGLFFFSFLLLPKAVDTCLFMLPPEALSCKTEHITAQVRKNLIPGSSD